MSDSVQSNPSDELVETYRQILVKVARLVRRSPTDDGGYFFADVPAMVERELSILRAAVAAPAPDRDTGEIADRIGAKQHPAWSSYRRARKGEQADEYGYVDEPMPAGDRNTHTMVTFTAGDGGTSLRTLTWGEVVPLVLAELAAGVGGVPAEPQPDGEWHIECSCGENYAGGLKRQDCVRIIDRLRSEGHVEHTQTAKLIQLGPVDEFVVHDAAFYQWQEDHDWAAAAWGRYLDQAHGPDDDPAPLTVPTGTSQGRIDHLERIISKTWAGRYSPQVVVAGAVPQDRKAGQ